MLLFLYSFIIEPLETAMSAVLHHAHTAVDNWGIALILLSLVVNCALLPIYHLAESWQEDERQKQKKIAPKLAEIKEVYSGKERYMLIKTLYRQNGYSPILALRTSCGLLIQIPFFFAAYHLLHAAPELSGVPFLFIKDLAQPDHLLTLGISGGMAINLLPFLMTAINLLSAAVYTTRLTKSQKIQLYGLAFIFLVFLYTSSSALLIYWTCNNIFSFLKNIIYTKYIYKDSATPLPASLLAAQERVLSPLRQFYSLLVHTVVRARYADILPGLLMVVTLVAALSIRKHQGTSFTALFYIIMSMACGIIALLLRGIFLKNAPLSSHKLPSCDTENARHSPNDDPKSFLATAAEPATTAIHVETKRLHHILGGQINGFLIPLGLIIFFCIFGLTSFKKLSDFSSWLYFRSLAAAIATLAIYAFSREPFFWLIKKAGVFCASHCSTTTSNRLFIASSVLTGVLVFYYTPALLYASDHTFFYESLAVLAGRLSAAFAISYAVAFFFYKRAGWAIAPLMAVTCAFFALIALLFTFAAAGDYGTLDGFMFQNPGLLRSRLCGVVDACAVLFAGTALFFIIKKNKIPACISLFHAITALIVLVSGVQLFLLPPAELVDQEYATTRLPEYNDRLFGFTKNGTNTIFFMLDMFTGGHVERIFAEDPQLAGTYEGFTWYRDTISPGSTTLLSIGALLGGPEYTPSAINSRNPRSIQEELHKGMAALPDIYVERGYDMAYADVEALIPDTFTALCPRASKMLIIGKSIITDYTGYWRNKNNLPSPLPESQAPFLAAVGFFRSAPWTLRQHIYYDGSWMNTQTLVHNPSEGPYAMLDILPKISNSKASSNTIKYIASQVAHYPWRLDGTTCMPIPDAPKTTAKDGVILEHYYAERCSLRALSKWLDWLKAEGVYDNTLIILASDHSAGDSAHLGPEFAVYRKKGIPWKPHSLLLVKPVGAHGPLRIDDSPMRGDDIPAIICENNKPCPENTRFFSAGYGQKQRIRTHDAGLASIRRHKKDRFIVDHYEVNGTMFSIKNWKLVSE